MSSLLEPSSKLAPDTILHDTYRIVGPLAQGGMAEVFRATHRRLSRTVAVKVLSADYAGKDEWSARFEREAMILGQLRHPNVVQVLDFNVAPDGSPYLVMELVDGLDVLGAMNQGRRFSPDEVASIVRQVASALSAAHALGVVHRDLKAENVLLCEAPGQPPVVKVIDFGISMWGATERRLTAEHTVFGTPEYMAPEQAQGHVDLIDGRTDQFSLAVLASTMLARRPPFRGDTPLAILFQIVHGQPAPLPARGGFDDVGVEAVLRRGMAPAREDRYPSVLDFADALERALRSPGTREPATRLLREGCRIREARTVPRRPRRRLPHLLASTAIALTVGLSIIPPGGHVAVGANVNRVRHTMGAGFVRLAAGVSALVSDASARGHRLGAALAPR
jgi:serine/threonine protein kinase